jgi:hypothetical protein
MQNYVVTPEFKSRVTDILKTKKFASVFPFMNLINREGFIYEENELNSLTQLLGEFPYAEVSEFFALVPQLVKKHENAKQESAPAEMALESQEAI